MTMERWAVVGRFCYQSSASELQLGGADTRGRVKPDNRGKGGSFAGLARVGRARSCMSVRVDNLEGDEFSFGIAMAPFDPGSRELLGERLDSWGVLVKGGKSMVGENGEYYSPVLMLCVGDILSLDIDLTRQRVAIMKNGALLQEWSVENTDPECYVAGVTLTEGCEAQILPMESPYAAPAYMNTTGGASGAMGATKSRYNNIVAGIQESMAVSQAKAQGQASAVMGSNLEDSIGSIGKMEGGGMMTVAEREASSPYNGRCKGSSKASQKKKAHPHPMKTAQQAPSSSSRRGPAQSGSNRKNPNQMPAPAEFIPYGYKPHSSVDASMKHLGDEAKFLSIPGALIEPHRPSTAWDVPYIESDISVLFPHLNEQRGRRTKMAGKAQANGPRIRAQQQKKHEKQQRWPASAGGGGGINGVYVTGIDAAGGMGLLPIFFSHGEVERPATAASIVVSPSRGGRARYEEDVDVEEDEGYEAHINPNEPEVHDRINQLVSDGLSKLENRQRSSNGNGTGEPGLKSPAGKVTAAEYRETMAQRRKEREAEAAELKAAQMDENFKSATAHLHGDSFAEPGAGTHTKADVVDKFVSYLVDGVVDTLAHSPDGHKGMSPSKSMPFLFAPADALGERKAGALVHSVSELAVGTGMEILGSREETFGVGDAGFSKASVAENVAGHTMVASAAISSPERPKGLLGKMWEIMGRGPGKRKHRPKKKSSGDGLLNPHRFGGAAADDGEGEGGGAVRVLASQAESLADRNSSLYSPNARLSRSKVLADEDGRPQWRPSGRLPPPPDATGSSPPKAERELATSLETAANGSRSRRGLVVDESVVIEAPRVLSDPVRVESLSKPLPRVLEHLESLKEHAPPPVMVPDPLHMNAYRGMRAGDVIVSVEYCYHCASHMTLKHDPGKYESMATQLMQALEMAVRGDAWVRGQEAKVTGVRVPINPKNYSQGVVHDARCIDTSSVEAATGFVPPASKEVLCQPAREGCRYNEFEQRTGALEIQVACKHPRFGLVVATLHSKLAVRKWPNPTLAAKRLKRFLDVCAAHDIDLPAAATTTVDTYVSVEAEADEVATSVVTQTPAAASESVEAEVATATEAAVETKTETLAALGLDNVATTPTDTDTDTTSVSVAAAAVYMETEAEPEPVPTAEDKREETKVEEGGGVVAESQEAETATDETKVEAAEIKEEETKASGAAADADAGTTTTVAAAAEQEKTEGGDEEPSVEA